VFDEEEAAALYDVTIIQARGLQAKTNFSWTKA
jgi:hypothetical protein